MNKFELLSELVIQAVFGFYFSHQVINGKLNHGSVLDLATHVKADQLLDFFHVSAIIDEKFVLIL
jgi:hypothetical protein